MDAIRNALNEHYRHTEPAKIVVQAVASTVGLFVVRYIVTNTEEFKEKVIAFTFGGLKAIPGVQGQKERDKVVDMISKKMALDQEKVVVIPEEGWSHEVILNKMKELKAIDDKHWKGGKVSGIVYSGEDEHVQLLNDAYALFSLSNPLHPEVFLSTRKYEAEIIRMTAEMMNGDKNVCGTLTTGGSESILMAVKAYRDLGKKRFPEMIVPVTAHAAFDKAAAYFGVKIIHIPLNKDMTVDIAAVEKAITRNTIMIAGSAPSFPHGIVDPIPEMAKLAQRYNIPFHTDACLGGFFLPWVQKAGLDGGKLPLFDFRVPGVTSMSVDTHKYGYTTKGTSVLLFANQELRQHMYFVQPNWPGGMYASPTMTGSRAGGVIACCWASLVAVGQKGFLDKSKKIYETAQAIKKGIREIQHLKLVGDSYSSVIAFESPTIDVFKIGDAMSAKGWSLNNLQKPSSIHICVTWRTVGMEEIFLNDLRTSVDEVVANPKAFPDGLAPMYGMAASFPDRTIIGDIATSYLDAILAP